MENKSYSVDGHTYSINVKKVKGNEYYVVNFRNGKKVVSKSTGMKPNKDNFRMVEKKALQIVSDYFANNDTSAVSMDEPNTDNTEQNNLNGFSLVQLQALATLLAPAASNNALNTDNTEQNNLNGFSLAQLQALATLLANAQQAAPAASIDTLVTEGMNNLCTSDINPQSTVSNVMFNDFAEDWLERNKPELANTTYVNYEVMLRKHIEPYFKGVILSNIKPMHLQKYVNEKKTEITINTVSKHISLMGTIFKDAVFNGFIQSNPAASLKKLPRKRPQTNVYNEAELKQLMSVSKGTVLEVPIFFAIMFGLRRSEIIGLRWEDIDFEKKTLTINGSVTRHRVDGKWVDVYNDKLKTEASHSTYKLNDYVCQYLKNLYRHNMSLISNVEDYKTFICVNEIGERLMTDYISHRFKKLLEEFNLKHIRFHDLRHSVVTLLSQNNFSMKDVQGYARHANIQTTADIYCHFDNENTLNELNAICSALDFEE